MAFKILDLSKPSGTIVMILKTRSQIQPRSFTFSSSSNKFYGAMRESESKENIDNVDSEILGIMERDDKSLHSTHGDDNQNSEAAAIRSVPKFQLLDVMVSHMGPITTNLLPLLPPHHLHAIIKKYLLTMHGQSELVNCKELGDVNPSCPALQLTETESNLPRQNALLASGFDPLPLNGVYDQGIYEMGSLGEYLTGGIHSWDSMHMMLVDMVKIENSNFLGLDMANDKNQAGVGQLIHNLSSSKFYVLSLLEIYLHENLGKPQVLSVYSNLVQAFVNTHTAEGNEQPLPAWTVYMGNSAEENFQSKGISKG
ncbi:hypothetical protein AAG906_021006 [Vitis piasezkii]